MPAKAAQCIRAALERCRVGGRSASAASYACTASSSPSAAQTSPRRRCQRARSPGCVALSRPRHSTRAAPKRALRAYSANRLCDYGRGPSRAAQWPACRRLLPDRRARCRAARRVAIAAGTQPAVIVAPRPERRRAARARGAADGVDRQRLAAAVRGLDGSLDRSASPGSVRHHALWAPACEECARRRAASARPRTSHRACVKLPADRPARRDA